MKLLCIGDSNTYGYDPHSCLGSRYPAEIRWTGRLTGHTVDNSGINGMSVPYDSGGFIDLIRSTQPDLVIVMLGVNNLLMGENAAQTAARMKQFLTALKAAGAPLLLIAPPPLVFGEWVQREALIDESKQLKVLYRQTALDSGAFFADAGEWNIELTYDGVHFSPDGHAAFAHGLEHTLKEVAASLL